MDFLKRIKEEGTLEKIIVRAIMAWLMTAIVFFVKTGESFNSSYFAFKIELVLYISFVLLFLGFFCALAYFRIFKWVEAYGPMLLLTLYGVLAVAQDQDVFLVIGYVILIAIAAMYAVSKVKFLADINNKSTVVIIYVSTAAVFLLIAGSVSVLRYLTYRNSTYDMGIWTQMFYYMKTTFQPLTTCERGYLLSHYAVHFSPVYYVYLPFFYLFPSAITLNILQVLTLASGFIPIFLLCRHYKLSKIATVVFGVLFGLFPSLATGCYYDLHENCFLTPFLLWLFYFIEKNNIKGIVAFTLLTFLVKEDAPVYLAAIGLFMMLEKKQYVKGGVLTAVSIVGFVLLTLLIGAFGLGVQSYRYDNFMTSASSGGLMDVIRSLFANPAYFISQCFTADKMQYLLYMFLPLGFLPFFTKKVAKYLLFIPLVLVNLASANQYQHSIFFQYTFGILAILFYMAISNYAEMDQTPRRFLGSVALCATIILLPMGSMSKSYYLESYISEQQIYSEIEEGMSLIPRDSSVSASTFFVPHLAQRDEIYMYPDQKHAEYLMLDLRWNEVTDTDLIDLRKQGYVTIKKVDHVYALLHKE